MASNKKPKTKAVYRLAFNVRVLRTAKGWAVEDACKKAGMSIPSWYRLEQGKYPGMVGRVVDKISDLFDVDVADLFRPLPDVTRTGPLRRKTKRAAAKQLAMSAARDTPRTD